MTEACVVKKKMLASRRERTEMVKVHAFEVVKQAAYSIKVN
jgi:hypothetical protein